jgi:hypothetical protein
MAMALPTAAKKQLAGGRRSTVSLFLAALLLLAAVGYDLLLQAPLAGLAVSVLALMWTVVALMVNLVKRQGSLATLAKHKASALLVGTYFASVGCGLLVSNLVMNETQVLRQHLLQSKQENESSTTPHGQQAAYATFCASRINGRCGWLNYRIYYSPDSMLPGATAPGTLVAHQFFTERVSIAIGKGDVLERRSVD